MPGDENAPGNPPADAPKDPPADGRTANALLEQQARHDARLARIESRLGIDDILAADDGKAGDDEPDDDEPEPKEAPADDADELGIGSILQHGIVLGGGAGEKKRKRKSSQATA